MRWKGMVDGFPGWEGNEVWRLFLLSVLIVRVWKQIPKAEQDQRTHQRTSHPKRNSTQSMLETMSFLQAQEYLYRWRQSSILLIGVNQWYPKWIEVKRDNAQENHGLLRLLWPFETLKKISTSFLPVLGKALTSTKQVSVSYCLQKLAHWIHNTDVPLCILRLDLYPVGSFPLRYKWENRNKGSPEQECAHIYLHFLTSSTKRRESGEFCMQKESLASRRSSRIGREATFVLATSEC